MSYLDWIALLFVSAICIGITIIFSFCDDLRAKFFSTQHPSTLEKIDSLIKDIIRQTGDTQKALDAAINSLREGSQIDKEKFTLFSQAVLSVFIVSCITILIILGKVDAAAGLPIISGVAGYFIAKMPPKPRNPPRETTPA